MNFTYWPNFAEANVCMAHVSACPSCGSCICAFMCFADAQDLDQQTQSTLGSDTFRIEGDCHMQVINDVINKVYEQDFDGAKVFKDYEQGLASLQNVISAASPGEHFQLPPQDSSQLKQVTYCSVVPRPSLLPDSTCPAATAAIAARRRCSHAVSCEQLQNPSASACT